MDDRDVMEIKDCLRRIESAVTLQHGDLRRHDERAADIWTQSQRQNERTADVLEELRLTGEASLNTNKGTLATNESIKQLIEAALARIPEKGGNVMATVDLAMKVILILVGILAVVLLGPNAAHLLH